MLWRLVETTFWAIAVSADNAFDRWFKSSVLPDTNRSVSVLVFEWFISGTRLSVGRNRGWSRSS